MMYTLLDGHADTTRRAPYGIMRQTLRIGNVATMLNGMVRLMLAKVSVGTVTNFLGLSSGADEGMNLLQQCVTIYTNPFYALRPC